ncbi:NUDIX domain-containing protein [Streptomyces sp. TLI_55]|uniref:NUDIX domain-containing protein n=1 Tax=Streptomyces sp. TLI_55 TaxID=1938861 RepID=UPI000BD864A6|nr:NUDIX domain-containing protein [Streptomyces sp. TLI_55]SNX66235.1 NUDIX domain-containing protein [Streptomyces sp. TLI_55]
MTTEQSTEGAVDAVVLYDGRVLLVNTQDRWTLPSGDPEPAESASATAARAVYELTGYLVDGSTPLPQQASDTAGGRRAVVCQLLSETPSDNARLEADQVRWSSLAEAVDAGLSETVRIYLEGHTPV